MRFGLVNFANPDMVGHTGVIPAAVEAVQTADRCLARVVETVESRGGVCLVTADHGNAELMLNPDGTPNTAHTTNPVPFIATRAGLAPARRRPARRRGADGARAARPRAAAGHDAAPPCSADQRQVWTMVRVATVTVWANVYTRLWFS